MTSMIQNSNANSAIITFLKSKNPNFAILYGLNFAPFDYLDTGWKQEIPELNNLSDETFQALKKSKRGQGALNDIVLKHFEADQSFIEQLTSFQSRFCLLPGDYILNLISYIGIALHAHWIHKIILGKDIRLIKDTVGEDLYAFCLKRLPFMMNWIISQDSYTQKPPLDQSLSTIVEKTGVHILYHWFQSEPEAVRKRLEMKMPPKFSLAKLGGTDSISYLASLDQAKIDLFIRKLIKERYPPWASLFS